MSPKLTKTVKLHYVKLVFRSILLFAAIGFYIYGSATFKNGPFALSKINKIILALIWIFFITEMFFRFFPAKIESMGCQKQFKKNFITTGYKPTKIPIQSARVTLKVVLTWVFLNAILGVLFFTKVIDSGILLIIALTYSVCDVICILFFCPFQTWFMKNKCCTTCRIYNWDYAMMFTPLIFIPNLYTWTLLGAALLLTIRWELAIKFHPERFSEICNNALHCANCSEKLCQHKRQLGAFIQNGKHLPNGRYAKDNLKSTK